MDEDTSTIQHGTFPRHEPDTINIRYVVVTGVGLAITLLLASCVAYGLYYEVSRKNPKSIEPPSFVKRDMKSMGPQLNAEQWRTLDGLRRAEEKLLEGYGWIDEKNGIARIPIDRAIEILSENGLQPSERRKEADQNGKEK